MRFTLSLVAALALSGAAWADPPSNVTPEGVIHVPAFDLPVSSQSSPQAQAGMRDNLYKPLPIETSSIPVYRATIDQYLFQPGIAKAKARYPVSIEETHVAGVHAFYGTPREVAPVNDDRTLINVHGGGYGVGGGSGGLAIPIAGVGHIKVLTLDYSMGPKAQYPTATRELVSVYKFLLDTYKPENIGIYGCPAVLAKFPPVLLMSGARAPDATVSEAALAKVGVDVRLHLWEGMWHTFMYDPDLPEAQQAYAVTARFFAANLGQKPG
jgi:acetyl esterase/lipase